MDFFRFVPWNKISIKCHQEKNFLILYKSFLNCSSFKIAKGFFSSSRSLAANTSAFGFCETIHNSETFMLKELRLVHKNEPSNQNIRFKGNVIRIFPIYIWALDSYAMCTSSVYHGFVVFYWRLTFGNILVPSDCPIRVRKAWRYQRGNQKL